MLFFLIFQTLGNILFAIGGAIYLVSRSSFHDFPVLQTSRLSSIFFVVFKNSAFFFCLFFCFFFVLFLFFFSDTLELVLHFFGTWLVIFFFACVFVCDKVGVFQLLVVTVVTYVMSPLAEAPSSPAKRSSKPSMDRRNERDRPAPNTLSSERELHGKAALARSVLILVALVPVIIELVDYAISDSGCLSALTCKKDVAIMEVTTLHYKRGRCDRTYSSLFLYFFGLFHH